MSRAARFRVSCFLRVCVIFIKAVAVSFLLIGGVAEWRCGGSVGRAGPNASVTFFHCFGVSEAPLPLPLALLPAAVAGVCLLSGGAPLSPAHTRSFALLLLAEALRPRTTAVAQSSINVVPPCTGICRLPAVETNFHLRSPLKRIMTGPSDIMLDLGIQDVFHTTSSSFSPVMEVRSASISWTSHKQPSLRSLDPVDSGDWGLGFVVADVLPVCDIAVVRFAVLQQRPLI